MSRFINHDTNATLTQDPDYGDAHLFTTRDVNSGEELTQDYREFESEEDLRKRGIDLNN